MGQIKGTILAEDIRTTNYEDSCDCAITRALKRVGYPFQDAGISIGHGNGWMSSENTVIENHVALVNTQEEINTTGNWQGVFRYGEIDTGLLNYAIQCDNTFSFNHPKNLHITCMDQRPGFKFPYEELNPERFETIREQHFPLAQDQSHYKKYGLTYY
jgi:hypothetical protein